MHVDQRPIASPIASSQYLIANCYYYYILLNETYKTIFCKKYDY